MLVMLRCDCFICYSWWSSCVTATNECTDHLNRSTIQETSRHTTCSYLTTSRHKHRVIYSDVIMSEASIAAKAQGPGKPLSEAIPDVTPEECANLHKAFDQLDSNNDGKAFHVPHGAAVCLLATAPHVGADMHVGSYQMVSLPTDAAQSMSICGTDVQMVLHLLGMVACIQPLCPYNACLSCTACTSHHMVMHDAARNTQHATRSMQHATRPPYQALSISKQTSKT